MILQIGRFGMRWQGGRIEFRSSVDEPDRWLVEYAGGHPTASGQTMTERTAMQLSAFFRGVSLVSNSIGIAPCRLFERIPNPDFQPDPSKPDFDPEKFRGRMKASSHPVDRLLHKQPNPEMTAKTFWSTLTGHKLCWGNGYAEIERDNAGRPLHLWPLRPDRTFPRRLDDGRLVYAVRTSSGTEQTLQPYQIFHSMGYTYDGLRGLSPVALNREGLGLAAAAQDYGARFFGNDARPGGILTTPQKLNDMTAKRLKNSWDEAHRGGAQSWRVAVLEQDVKWQNIGMPNEDAQWLQTRVFSIGEVARILGVPPHKLFDLSHATFSNIEHQSIEYIQDGVLPWAEAFEQEISRKLLMPGEEERFYAEFNFDAQMRGDLKSRYEAYQIAFQNSWRSADEIGEYEHWNPQPNKQGRTHWVQVTMQPVEKALTAGPDPDPDDSGDGSDGSEGDAAKNKGGKNPADPGIRKPAKQAKRALAEQRLIMTRAYAHALALVYRRLASKEASALPKDLSGSLAEHRRYTEEAIEPVLGAMFDSIREAEQIDPVFATDARLKTIVIAAADRYLDALRSQVIAGEARSLVARLDDWKKSSRDRANEEAARIANYFVFDLHQAAGTAEFRWILVGKCDPLNGAECCSASETSSRKHPPVHAGCECQIVAAKPQGEK